MAHSSPKAAALALVSLLAIGEAVAEPGVEFEVIDDCPSEQWFRGRVEAQLGEPWPEALSVGVGVGTESNGSLELVLEIRVDGDQGSRSLMGDRCSELLEAGALIVALAYSARATPAPATSAGPKPSFAIRSGASANLGPMPGLSPAIDLALAADHLAWRVETGVSYSPRTSERIEGEPMVGGDFWLALASLKICREIRRPLAVCAGAELGRMRAEGVGVDQPRSETLWVPSVVGGIAAATRLWRTLSLRLELEGAALLHRPSFTLVNPDREVFHTRRVSGRFGLGLEVVFW